MRRVLLLTVLLCGTALGAGDNAVFREDFEHFDRKNWDDFGESPKNVEMVEGGPSGKGKCVQVTAHLGKDTGAHLYRMLDPGMDTCHVRFYVKFDKDHDYIHHFVHLCAY